MNVKELKKAIYAFLRTKADRVYDQESPPEASFPYVIYILEDSATDENQVMEVFNLTVEVYDNNKFDTTTLDALVGTIDGNGSITGASGLHRKHYFSQGVLRADFYRYDRETFTEKDSNIIHTDLSYEVMAYLT